MTEQKSWELGGSGSIYEGNDVWYLVVLGHLSMGRYSLIIGDTGSVQDGNGWNLVVLGQHRAV